MESISAGNCAGVDLTESIRLQDFYLWWRRWHDDRLSKLLFQPYCFAGDSFPVNVIMSQVECVDREK